MRRSLATLFLAGSLFAAPALAASPGPPPPASIDDAGVTAWLRAHIKAEGWTLISADDAAVTMGSPDGVGQLRDKTLKTQVRREYYRPVKLGPMDSRSNLQTWIVNCKTGKIRVIAMEIYPANNLSGQGMSKTMDDATWSEVTPGSQNQRAVKRICEAPTTGKLLK